VVAAQCCSHVSFPTDEQEIESVFENEGDPEGLTGKIGVSDCAKTRVRKKCAETARRKKSNVYTIKQY
jgi:hypothetical protein